jgi:hypothetical protein
MTGAVAGGARFFRAGGGAPPVTGLKVGYFFKSPKVVIPQNGIVGLHLSGHFCSGKNIVLLI